MKWLRCQVLASQVALGIAQRYLHALAGRHERQLEFRRNAREQQKEYERLLS